MSEEVKEENKKKKEEEKEEHASIPQIGSIEDTNALNPTGDSIGGIEIKKDMEE